MCSFLSNEIYSLWYFKNRKQLRIFFGKYPTKFCNRNSNKKINMFCYSKRLLTCRLQIGLFRIFRRERWVLRQLRLFYIVVKQCNVDRCYNFEFLILLYTNLLLTDMLSMIRFLIYYECIPTTNKVCSLATEFN